MQYARNYLANGRGEWGWLYHASYPYTVLWSLEEKSGKSLAEMGRVSWSIVYIYPMTSLKWAIACCVTNLLKRAVWSLKPGWVWGSGQGGLERGRAGAEQGLYVGTWERTLSWEEGCGTRRKTGESAREGWINSRRSGKKNKVSSTADIGNMPWSHSWMSCAKELMELQRGKQENLLPWL